MLIYGLGTCPDCQKARKALDAAGMAYTFRDVRAQPLSEAELAVLVTEFGDRLVDRTTNDWRSASDWIKASEAEEQIASQPKLMARPVFETEGVYHLGWTEDVQAALGLS